MSAFVTLDHQEAVECPRCGSLNVHPEKRGFSILTGFIRSHQILMTCLKCAYRYKLQRPLRQSDNATKATLIFIGVMALLLGAIHLAHAGKSTAQRDAPTVRFYTPDGKSAGTASTYGNTTKFYAPDGKLTGSATRDRTR